MAAGLAAVAGDSGHLGSLRRHPSNTSGTSFSGFARCTGQPLIFGVIHETPTLKLYYPVAGLLTIAIASGMQRRADDAGSRLKRSVARKTPSATTP